MKWLIIALKGFLLLFGIALIIGGGSCLTESASTFQDFWWMALIVIFIGLGAVVQALPFVPVAWQRGLGLLTGLALLLGGGSCLVGLLIAYATEPLHLTDLGSILILLALVGGVVWLGFWLVRTAYLFFSGKNRPDDSGNGQPPVR